MRTSPLPPKPNVPAAHTPSPPSKPRGGGGASRCSSWTSAASTSRTFGGLCGACPSTSEEVGSCSAAWGPLTARGSGAPAPPTLPLPLTLTRSPRYRSPQPEPEKAQPKTPSANPDRCILELFCFLTLRGSTDAITILRTGSMRRSSGASELEAADNILGPQLSTFRLSEATCSLATDQDRILSTIEAAFGLQEAFSRRPSQQPCLLPETRAPLTRPTPRSHWHTSTSPIDASLWSTHTGLGGPQVRSAGNAVETSTGPLSLARARVLRRSLEGAASRQRLTPVLAHRLGRREQRGTPPMSPRISPYLPVSVSRPCGTWRDSR